MYKLYYAPGSASMGIRVLLEEIGAPYELLETSIDIGAERPAEQLKFNPNGWIPVLLWGQDHSADGAMYEAAAIAIFLCDRHPDAALAPAVDRPERALYLQTLVYFSNTIQTAFQQFYYPARFSDEPDNEPGAQRRGIRRLTETWRVIDAQIGENHWVLGKTFSAVDIFLYMLTTWLDPDKDHPRIEAFPNVARIAHAVAQRPSVQRVYGV